MLRERLWAIVPRPLIYAGRYDGDDFERPSSLDTSFYKELRPISDEFEPEALAVNGLDRARLCRECEDLVVAMNEASAWIHSVAGGDNPVLVAYPLSFDWSWLY